MSEYIRVRDYREQQLIGMTNVDIFRESLMRAEDVLAVEADHVAIATGARWRPERFDDETYRPVAVGPAAERVFTPDDIMEARLPDGPTIVFDGDGYFMGRVLAERIRQEGHEVTHVTPDNSVSRWAGNTSERWRIRTHLLRLGVRIESAQTLTGFDGSEVVLECAYSGAETTRPATAVVMVTARTANDALFRELLDQAGGKALPFSLARIGDCDALGIIAAAV